jgi:hypothetical protein
LPESDRAAPGPAGVGDNSRNGFFILTPFKAFDPASLPPREWLYGRHYQRQTVSATFAPGGTGKSSLSMVENIAMATARNLLGEQPTERVRVWYHNGEDSMKDLQRRLASICLHYGIPMEELEGWFFMTSGNEVPLRVANGYSDFKPDVELIRKIRNDIELGGIGAVTFDPFITTHGVPEQDNTKMDFVVRTFSSIADASTARSTSSTTPGSARLARKAPTLTPTICAGPRPSRTPCGLLAASSTWRIGRPMSCSSRSSRTAERRQHRGR